MLYRHEHTKFVVSSWNYGAHVEREASTKGHVAICTIVVKIREVRLYKNLV